MQNFVQRELCEKVRRSVLDIAPDTLAVFMKKLIPQEKYYENLPKKRIAAGVLLFDAHNRLLIVKPSYKASWSIPGGTVELNESPRETAIRETKEEIGLDLTNISLICIDHASAKGVRNESLQLIFYGGVLDQNEIGKIIINEPELNEFDFVEVSKAALLLGEGLRRRLPFCLEAITKKTVVYIET